MKKSGRLPRSQFRGCVLFENDQRPSIFRSAQSDGRSFMLLPDEAELAFVKVLSSPEILDRERNAGNVCSGRQQKLKPILKIDPRIDTNGENVSRMHTNIYVIRRLHFYLIRVHSCSFVLHSCFFVDILFSLT